MSLEETKSTTCARANLHGSIVDRAIAAAGLDSWLARRLQAPLGPLDEPDVRFFEERVGALDLLVLGALADRVRRAERGDDVRVHLQRATAEQDEGVTFSTVDPRGGGISFVRAVATARLLGPAHVRVDVGAASVQLAQVALAFGADELIAPIARRTLGIASSTTASDAHPSDAAVLRERELAALVRAAGRRPIFVEVVAGRVVDREVDESSATRRRFRAPGREGTSALAPIDGAGEELGGRS